MKNARNRLSIVVLLLTACFAPHASARPTAMDLFPRETLAFGRVAHFRELFDKLKQSSMGRMLQDPALQPLIDHLYGSAEEAYAEQAEEEVGLTLSELQQIPQGEFAIGMVARPNERPTFAVLLDMGDDPEAARKLLDRIQTEMIDNGASESTQTVGDTELTILVSNADERIVFFERENTLVACGDSALAEAMLAFWDGQTPAPFADEGSSRAATFWTAPLTRNEQFAAVMTTCRAPGDPAPQIVWYVDPIDVFRQLNRENVGAQLALGMLPSLGLNGLQAVGGSFTFATGQYEDVTHVHVLLDTPREGVLTLVNLTSGDTTPERFIPSEWMDTYMTVHWNAPLTYDKLAVLHDKIRGTDGGFAAAVEENINEELGIDFRGDVIEQLDGRVSAVFGFHQPVSFNRRSLLIAAHLKDAEAGAATFQKVLDRARQEGAPLEEGSFGGVDYWVIVPEPFQAMEVDERPFEACFALLEGCLIFANDRQMIERAVAARDGTSERLADALDFKLVHSRIGRIGQEPGMIGFNRPEVGLRYIYDLLNSDRTRDFLAEQRETNRFFTVLDDALAEHPLPAFEVLAKYFAPSGSIGYDSATGLHFYAFSLRRQ